MSRPTECTICKVSLIEEKTTADSPFGFRVGAPVSHTYVSGLRCPKCGLRYSLHIEKPDEL